MCIRDSRTIVDDELWSLVEGVLRFAETSTVWIEGRRHLVPDYSPENAPDADASPIVADATMDVAILRDAARAASVLARARGDRSLDDRWAGLAASLPPYRVADDGTLAEWISDLWPENVAHRHTSQLYPLWYEPDPAFVGSTASAARLRDAAAATVAAKIAWRAQDRLRRRAGWRWRSAWSSWGSPPPRSATRARRSRARS